MSTVVTMGLDLAKSAFQIHGVDDADRAVLRRRHASSPALAIPCD